MARTSGMSSRAKRFALLLIGLGLLAMSLVACAASASPNTNGSSDSGVGGFKTPNPGLFTPTPAFPPFTIGAWPSTYSPQNNDTVTIYVLCRIQSDMNGPPRAASGIPVHVQVDTPINKGADGTTDTTGLAAIAISFNDPQSGTPVRVDITAPYQGHSYLAQTFFTPNVTQPLPTATSAVTATP